MSEPITGRTLLPETDCYCCKDRVSPDGRCACDLVDGPCAGVLVRPHMCWPRHLIAPGGKGSSQQSSGAALVAWEPWPDDTSICVACGGPLPEFPARLVSGDNVSGPVCGQHPVPLAGDQP